MGLPVHLVASLVLVFCWGVCSEAKLKVGFYRHKCPRAESIVREGIQRALRNDSGIAADFVRMHFHDCFVRGCDGSILLDSTNGKQAEKDAPVNNPSLEGFDVIDTIKSELEATCPGVVSCADIITFAARDSVELSRGQRYEVPSGRRDGRVSKRSEATKELPPPTHNLAQLTSTFAKKGLTQKDLVALSGAHTIGKATCTTFDNRLYSFSTTTKQDPSLEPSFAKKLKRQCPGGRVDANISVSMDPLTPETVDSNYFKNILSHRVVFTSDQSLTSSRRTAAQVKAYAQNEALFKRHFAKAMVKMGRMGVKTGTRGEVRRNCRVVN